MEPKAEFKIVDIEILRSAIDARSYTEPITEFNFKVEAQIKTDIVTGLAISIVDININQANKEEVLGTYTAAVHFNIINIKEILKMEENGPHLPDIVVGMFNSVAISTVRGMMFEAYRGTFLHSAILPVIDIHKMLQDRKQT